MIDPTRLRALLADHPPQAFHQREQAAIRDVWEAAREMLATNEWQPIETAPKDAVVMVWNGDFITMGRYWSQRKCWIDYADEGDEFTDPPTHWQPLPQAPGGRNG